MIKIYFFARYRELMGRHIDELEFTGSLQDLLQINDLAKIPTNALITIDDKVANGTEMVISGSQISFLPPVSGG